MKKRILALIMCACTLLLLLPLGAIADGGNNVEDGIYKGNVWTAGGNGTLSYCTYDGTKLSLSKTAVDKGNNVFDINLKVVAESREMILLPGAAATVLLMDASESMNYCSNCGQQFCMCNASSRLDASRAAAVNFIDSYKGDVAGIGRFVSIVQFSNGAYKVLGWVDVSTKIGYDAAVKAIYSTGTNYGTNLDTGLCAASNMFSAPEIAMIGIGNRYVVALSDGAPNLSRSGGSGIYGSMQVNNDTAAAAEALRKCATVYTVGFGTLAERTYTGGPAVNDFLRDSIANPAFGGFTYAYTADTADQLNAVFAAISKSIKSSIGSSGCGAKVVDPMGQYVSVVSCPAEFQSTDMGYVWQLGAVEPKVTNKWGKTTYEYTYSLTYTVKLDADAEGFNDSIFYPANKITVLKWSVCENFVFPVPGIKGETSQYTVIFNKGTNGVIEGQDNDGNVTCPNLKKWSATPAAPEVTPDAGYSFTGWLPVLADKVTENITYVAQYTPNEDTQYKIEYYLEQLDGSFKLEQAETKTAVTDTVVEVTDADKLEFTGYTLDTSVDGTVLSGTVAGDGSLALKLYYVRNCYDYSIEYYYGGVLDESKTETGKALYGVVIDSYADKIIPGYVFSKTENLPLTIGDGENVIKVYYDVRTDLTYTVNYLWNGTDTAIAPSVTVADQTLGASISELPIAIEGYTPVSSDAQTITIDVDNNVINFYYYKNVCITANSAEAVYDGQEHSVSGFTGAPEEADFGSITVGASGILAGEYPAAFEEGTVGTVDKTEKFIISEAIDGQLNIFTVGTEIVITANSAEKVYDGTALSDAGFTYTQDVLVEGDVLTAVVEGSQTDAGSSANVVVSFKVMRGDVDVTNQYNFGEAVNGTLTVAPRDVTITSGSANKVYDGKALTCDTVTADNFVEGQGASYNVTGSQTKVGSSSNTFEYTLNEGTKAENYNITVVEGTLTVTPEAAPKTGDDSNSTLWAVLMGLSAMGIAGIAVIRKRNKFN